MRQWAYPPPLMCRQHLLGEHNEHHALLGILRLGMSVKGYLDGGLFDPPTLKTRHDQLVDEMVRRQYNHHTPLELTPDILSRIQSITCVPINHYISSKDLLTRCPECRVVLYAELKALRQEEFGQQELFYKTLARFNNYWGTVLREIDFYMKDNGAWVYGEANAQGH